jgi:hypothetical protein
MSSGKVQCPNCGGEYNEGMSFSLHSRKCRLRRASEFEDLERFRMGLLGVPEAPDPGEESVTPANVCSH